MSRRKFINEAQQLVIEYLLDHPCQNCGEDDPVVLEFHHRDPSNKILSISEIVSKLSSMDFGLLREEIDKTDVLCANCHRRITAKDYNYKRYQLCLEMRIIDY